MATNTTNYNLIKPAYSDTADIGDINDNMDAIDTAMQNNKDATLGIASVITGSTNNSGHAISEGEYFIANGTKYIATAAIPSGSAWSGSSQSVSTHDFINMLGSGKVDNGYKDLGTFTNESGLTSALDSQLSSMPIHTTCAIQFVFSSAAGAFDNVRYQGFLGKAGGNGLASLLVQSSASATKTGAVTGSKNSTWVFEKLALASNSPKFEKKALTNGSNVTYTFSDNTPFTLQIYRQNATATANNGFYVGQAHTAGSVREIVASGSCTVSISGKTLTMKASADNMIALITTYGI